MMEAYIRVMVWGGGEVDSLEKEKGSTGLGEQQVSEVRGKGSSTMSRIWAWAGWMGSTGKEQVDGSSIHRGIFRLVKHPHEAISWAVRSISLMLKRETEPVGNMGGCQQ